MMSSTPHLLILYKFSLPSLGAAVSSFVYLHSNNIMKTQSDLKNTPSQATFRVSPPHCLLLLLCWRPFPLCFGDLTYFPLRTLKICFYAGTKLFASHPNPSQPLSQLKEKAQMWEGALGSLALTQLCAAKHSMETVP